MPDYPERWDDVLQDWHERLVSILVDMLRRHADELRGRDVYAAALTVAGPGEAIGFTYNTQDALDEVWDDELDPAVLGEYRWWPDEWGTYLDAPEQAADTQRLRALVREIEQYDTGVNRESDLAVEWNKMVLGTLWLSLGADEVRAEFARLGSDPILIVADPDGDNRWGWMSLSVLNEGRDDERYRDAYAYWQTAAEL